MNRRHKIGPEWVASTGWQSKRSFDVLVASGVALPTCLVVGAAATISVLKEREAAFFVQQRIGRGGLPFNMLKLRTMPKGTPVMRAHDIPNDIVTPYQQKIRKYRINELPQIQNVLRGDMSIVGPRPETPVHAEETMDTLSVAMQRDLLAVQKICRPGLIDPYTVAIDLQDDSPIDIEARAEAHIRYANTATFKGDIQIICGTARVLRAREAASALQFEAMPYVGDAA